METLESSESIAPAEGPNAAADTKQKREFVVPEVTPPVDVLEATTFFQVATSGATN